MCMQGLRPTPTWPYHALIPQLALQCPHYPASPCCSCRRLPNGTAAPAAAVVGLSDSASYDMFGPSIKHGEPFLEHLASVGPPLAAWVVDGEEATMRAARVGVSYAISNEPLVVLGRLRDAMEECGGSGAAAVGPGAGVGAGKGLAADGGVEEVGGGAEGMGETKVGMGSERR